jgi:hypothetical protein
VKVHEQSGLEWFLEWANMTGSVSPGRARVVMNELRRNPAAVAAVRRVMGQRTEASRLNDAELLDAVMRQIDSGALVMSWTAAAKRAPQAPSAAPAPAAPPAPAVRESRPVEPEPEGFPPNHDQDAQALALIAASNSGVPFCEECERARQQQRQEAA